MAISECKESEQLTKTESYVGLMCRALHIKTANLDFANKFGRVKNFLFDPKGADIQVITQNPALTDNLAFIIEKIFSNKTLPFKDAEIEILRERYGLNDGYAKNLFQIADIHQCSFVWIRNREYDALRKIKRVSLANSDTYSLLPWIQLLQKTRNVK